MKVKINWIEILKMVLLVMIMSFIGMSLPPTIAKLNFNNLYYGTWASYSVSMILFWIIIKDTKLTK